jgi:hypothetical protein
LWDGSRSTSGPFWLLNSEHCPVPQSDRTGPRAVRQLRGNRPRPVLLIAACIASGARSSSPGQTTAPISTWTCSNKVRSRSRANTPACGDAMSAERSTMPVSPSTNRTNKRSSGSAVTSCTRHGAVGRMAGVTEAARSSLAAASAGIDSSPPSVRHDVPGPTQEERQSSIRASCSAYNAWKCGGGWSCQNIWIKMP